MNECKGGEETGFDRFTNQVIHENDEDWHPCSPLGYGVEE